ncbi:Isochorismatase hydrolase [Mytilinidion resinicola]|uniref:Isochorismatase hydrolase n=1 Tax=Mytilinidion resinicola TaxID=574789 RepID=A0A6A6Y2B0_9PEZI|nr:Isochorismatase hydrolase [Mytilinidion resinicola]KAF2802144.1 Isochorismatase hydrolase [Mytilinidion resinicola]
MPRTTAHDDHADALGGLETTNSPITIAPEQNAMAIIDAQNFFLSRSLGRTGAGHVAEEALLKSGIPAARKAHIQVVWLTWGLSEADLDTMDPTTARIFQFDGTEKRQIELTTRLGSESQTYKRSASSNMELFCDGIGSDVGLVQLLSGKIVPGGRLLMQGQWNTALHAPLEAAYQDGIRLDKRPDVRFHKSRLSGMCDTMTACTDFLRANGFHTLLFGGVNTDQCVLATIQDANLKGFDTILFKDGCGTNSPEGAQSSTEYNCEECWGFLSSCDALARAVSG